MQQTLQMRRYFAWGVTLIALCGAALTLFAPLRPRLSAAELRQGFDAPATVTSLVQTRDAILALLTATAVTTAGQTTPAPVINRAAPPQVEIRAAGLNVRAGPGTNFAVLTNVPAGASFTIVGRAGDCAWLKISDGASELGWVSGNTQFVSYTTPCASIPLAQ